MFQLENVKTAVIVGAGHGIGLAICQNILQHVPQARVFATFRDSTRAEGLRVLKGDYHDRLNVIHIDPLDEAALAAAVGQVKEKSPSIDLLINVVGVLNDEICQPEKGLGQISLEKMQRSFSINAAITPLLAKYFFSQLRKSPQSAFASISAKVGSITDNRLGGWYSYRASKAALNMFVKNIALEFSNRSVPCISVAIHPGTTKTQLSEQYLKNTKLKVHQPSDSAANILAVINGLEQSDSGKFYSWDGSTIPW
ncbi:MAG: SDR family NAD(P)-dependent oxidoreductase [Oligoflexales bacterium]|nr:SDR family NAD(P)-dependent oxidoreductase [Oligoflexales bacterium]